MKVDKESRQREVTGGLIKLSLIALKTMLNNQYLYQVSHDISKLSDFLKNK